MMKGLTARDQEFRFGGFVVALVAFAPFLRMVASGQSLFFRDLSAQFFPSRRFLLDVTVRHNGREPYVVHLASAERAIGGGL